MILLKTLSKVDRELFCRVYKYTLKRDCSKIVWLSRTGDGHLYFLIGMALWLFEPDFGELFLYTTLMAYALELPLYLILKNAFRRPRPCDFLLNYKSHITPSDKFSLPSGHTAAAWLMASVIAHFYPPFALLGYSWAALIGMSRILLGVHYPSDVIAGMLLGTTIASLSLAVWA